VATLPGKTEGGRCHCTPVQRAVEDAGIPFEIVKEPSLPRSRRKRLEVLSGQRYLPVVEFGDESIYREESEDMAARIRAGTSTGSQYSWPARRSTAASFRAVSGAGSAGSECTGDLSSGPVREVVFTGPPPRTAAASFAACLATILELPLGELPEPLLDEDAAGWGVMRWLGGMGLGLVPVADAASFSWAGPWIGWVVPADGAERRGVVMFGVPSGVAWDPCGVAEGEGWLLEGGFVVSVLDVALARPLRLEAPLTPGTVEAIFVAPEAGRRPARLRTCTLWRAKAWTAIATQ
jgi:hypothetical protein